MHDSDTSVYSIRVVMRYVSKLLHTISFTKFGSDFVHALKFDFTSEITGETEALDIPFGVGFFYPSE